MRRRLISCAHRFLSPIAIANTAIVGVLSTGAAFLAPSCFLLVALPGALAVDDALLVSTRPSGIHPLREAENKGFLFEPVERQT